MVFALIMASNKFPSDSAECSKAKGKHVTLTIMQKAEILKKSDKDESVHKLRERYGASNTTTYDITKQLEKLLKVLC